MTTIFVVAPFPKGSPKAAFFGFSLQKKQAKFELHKSVFDDEKVEDGFIIKNAPTRERSERVSKTFRETINRTSAPSEGI
ncbi:hypothetical protein LRP52_46325 [Photobacterium sp. ZSDE20]|nr:hypothetical protein [Photobacterium sp. ZSDE20]